MMDRPYDIDEQAGRVPGDEPADFACNDDPTGNGPSTMDVIHKEHAPDPDKLTITRKGFHEAFWQAWYHMELSKLNSHKISSDDSPILRKAADDLFRRMTYESV